TEKFVGDLLIETTKDVASMMGAEGYLDALEKVETEGVELTEAGKKIEAFSKFVYDTGKFIGSLGEKWNNLLGRGINFILGPPKGDKTPIDAFAKGGYPDKGSLFIAGEAGPELVGNINGRTEVIPMYANGTPGATKFRQIDSQDVTDDLNKLFKMMGDLVKKGLKKILPEVTATLTPGGEKIKNVIDSLKMFVEGVKNTDIAKGVSEKIKEFVDNLKNGTGLLGKTWKLMGNITKGMGKLAVQAFGTLNSPSARAVFASTPNEGETSTGQQREIAGGFIGGILGDSTAGMVFNLLQQIADGAILEFVQNLPQFVQAGLDMVMNLLDGVVKALPVLLAEIPVIIQKIVEILTNKDTIQALITAMLDIVLQLALALPDIILALVDAIPTVIDTLIEVLLDNVDMFFKVGVILASAIVEGLVNIIIGGINWLIKQINKIPFVNIGYLSTVSWTAKLAENMGFAEGGYPTQGQMFIAREAGAELVGNVGGRTSVMNNEQIVESVSRGVYEAVLQAMAEQSQKETVINLDGKRVSERMDVVNRNRGLSFGMGGY
ncbi:MAG: hypothetical protein ACOYJC_11715, partial [Christensenellales bacterium]